MTKQFDADDAQQDPEFRRLYNNGQTHLAVSYAAKEKLEPVENPNKTRDQQSLYVSRLSPGSVR